jgi:hypothetical protein
MAIVWRILVTFKKPTGSWFMVHGSWFMGVCIGCIDPADSVGIVDFSG